jgi:hypothetical protein
MYVLNVRACRPQILTNLHGINVTLWWSPPLETMVKLQRILRYAPWLDTLLLLCRRLILSMFEKCSLEGHLSRLLLMVQVTSPATCKNCLSVGFSATVNNQYRFLDPSTSLYHIMHCDIAAVACAQVTNHSFYEVVVTFIEYVAFLPKVLV